MDILTLPWVLEHASYGLMLVLLLAGGLGLPIPEDVILIAAGALVHRGITGPVGTALACGGGVLGGDLLIFLIARHLGVRALERAPFRHMLPPERRRRLEGLFERWGGGIVFAARHVAGIRAPVFALAGMHGMHVLTFLLWDAAGLMISAPLMIGLGYLFSDRLAVATHDVARLEHVVIIAAVVALAGYAIYAVVRNRFSR